MCISETKSCIPGTHFFDLEDNPIKTVSTMKVLGFQFPTDPDIRVQVESIRRKFVARIWTLRHLGHRGFSQEDLLKVCISV